MIGYIQAAILAVIQGITAWIPVSSKTQVILAANAWFSTPFETALAFALILHLGDLVAALYRYRTEYIGTVRTILTKPSSVTDFTKGRASSEYSFLTISIIATIIVAVPAYLLVKKVFFGLNGDVLLALVGVLLLVMAAITWFSHKAKRPQAPVTALTSIVTGAAQGLSVIPGISRSGITQCALILQGVDPQESLRLSFLMSAPMIAAAIVAFYFVQGFAGFSLGVALLGIAISAVVSLLTMDALTRLAGLVKSYYFIAGIGLLAIVPFVINHLVPAIAAMS
jgi:undecaprenyl-diphosphatase